MWYNGLHTHRFSFILIIKLRCIQIRTFIFILRSHYLDHTFLCNGEIIHWVLDKVILILRVLYIIFIVHILIWFTRFASCYLQTFLVFEHILIYRLLLNEWGRILLFILWIFLFHLFFSIIILDTHTLFDKSRSRCYFHWCFWLLLWSAQYLIVITS